MTEKPSPWNLKIDINLQNQRSAKDKLFELGKKVLEVVKAPQVIDLKIYKYNVVHKLAEEINKLTEQQAADILTELKKEIEKW
jgi:hypothetical protein